MNNQHGKPWEESDVLLSTVRAGIAPTDAYIMVSRDGEPLCGRYVPGKAPTLYVHNNWSTHYGNQTATDNAE